MKAKHILLFLLLLAMTTGPLLAQKIYQIKPAQMQFLHAERSIPTKTMDAHVAPQKDGLQGTWFQSWDNQREDYIVYKRADENKMQWGNYLEFNDGKSIAKGYSAPCGNDTNIHRHPGKFNQKGNTLFLNLGKNGIYRYKIVEMSETELVLVEIK